jgi:hypothetical protein
VPDSPPPASPDVPPPAFSNLGPVRGACSTGHQLVRVAAWVNSGPVPQETRRSHAACAYASLVTPGATEALDSRLDALTTAQRDPPDAASTIRTHRRAARAVGAWLTAPPSQLRDGTALRRARDRHAGASPAGPPRRAHLAGEWAGRASAPRGPAGHHARRRAARGVLLHLPARRPAPEIPARALSAAPRRPPPSAARRQPSAGSLTKPDG